MVIPTRGRVELLERCLQAVCSQTLPTRNYEVIVVDDGGDHETRAMMSRWTRRRTRENLPTFQFVVLPLQSGPAIARNRGWRQARGQIIAFTDNDCVPEADWLQAGLAAMAADVAGASGRIVVPLREHPTDYELNAAGLRGAEFATANCFYRRAVLDDVGGFDEHFEMAWREDADVYLTLVERGYPLAHAPDAVVVHPVRRERWGISITQQKKSQYNALLYKKHPRLYGDRIQSSPPWHYYQTVAALMVMAFAMLTKRSNLARLALVFWLGRTLHFCRKRLASTSRAPGHVTDMLVSSLLIPPLAIFWRLWGAVRFRVVFL